MNIRYLFASAVLCSAMAVQSLPASAAILFDFENDDPLSSTLVSGDIQHFAADTAQNHSASGTKSLKFVDNGPDPYESWTYDMPFNMTSGTVTVWFYDSLGNTNMVNNPFLAQWAGSVILENKNDPSDFGAVELCNLMYGGGRYYASEGSVDRGGGTAGDTFDSDTLPVRSIGFHKVEFVVGTTQTAVLVDGVQSDEIMAPGSGTNGDQLRLRFMADSPSNGGRGHGSTWYSAPATTSFGTAEPWMYYDDITFNADLPSVQTHTCGFEVTAGTPDFDQAAVSQGPSGGTPPHDNPLMHGFVNQWEQVTSATVAHSGTGSARFANPTPAFKSVTFDLSNAAPNTTATIWFYDAKGDTGGGEDFTVGGSIILENGIDPAEFEAVEIWSAPYPASGDPTPGGPNYYLTQGAPGSPASGMFYSRAFGNRTIGWHKVEIGLYADYSLIAVDGILNSENSTVYKGPGLDKSPKLRLMADSATSGGFANWTDVDELNTVYFETTDPFIYYDDIELPVAGDSAVSDWMNY